MKITFDDDSYVSFNRNEKGQGILSIGARNTQNRLAMVVNTVELTREQQQELFKETDELR